MRNSFWPLLVRKIRSEISRSWQKKQRYWILVLKKIDAHALEGGGVWYFDGVSKKPFVNDVRIDVQDVSQNLRLYEYRVRNVGKHRCSECQSRGPFASEVFEFFYDIFSLVLTKLFIILYLTDT